MSMAFTYYNPLKFRRFAEQVLGERYEQDRAQLRHDFKQVLDRLLGTAYNDWHRGLYPTEEGFGRTDAFGRIANSVFGDAIDPANYRVANAPVSYPHLWDIWKFDWVQWNGSAMQPMARNIGEALGVGATLRLLHDNGQPVAEAERYASGVRVRDLHGLETTLMQLAPPRWPEDVLGAIDLTQASLGRARCTKENCAHCPTPGPSRSTSVSLPNATPSGACSDPHLLRRYRSTTADNIADHRFDLTCPGWTVMSWIARMCSCMARHPARSIASLSSAKGWPISPPMSRSAPGRDAGIGEPSARNSTASACRSACRNCAATRHARWTASGRRRPSCTTARCRHCSSCCRRWPNGRSSSGSAAASTIRSTGIRTERFDGGFR